MTQLDEILRNTFALGLRGKGKEEESLATKI